MADIVQMQDPIIISPTAESTVTLANTDIIMGTPVSVSTIVLLDPQEVNIGNGLTKSSVWTGEGPPHLVIGASVGDEYLDTLTGTLYRLDPGA